MKTEQVKRQAARLVRNHREEHERTLAEEKRRWEVDRLREEAAREKRIAEEMRAMKRKREGKFRFSTSNNVIRAAAGAAIIFAARCAIAQPTLLYQWNFDGASPA